MNTKKTIIRVRRGVNGFKYSACDNNGCFIGNFKKLSDVRRHWSYEIKHGYIVLVRELDQMPDMSKWEEEKEALNKLVQIYAKMK